MRINPKIALVVDALPGLGGAEKVLLAVSEMLPDAPVFTLVYNRQAFGGTVLARRQVKTSFIESLPLVRTQYRKYLPLMPRAIQQFDLAEYDVVVSFSYAVAHGVRIVPGQTHISYTYTPMRYAWRGYHMDGTQGSANALLDRLYRPFREWDLGAVANVDQFAAVSTWIADWIKRVYLRDSQVIYPPVDIDRFQPAAERGNYFITVSRLVPHKRLDLVIEAFNRLKLPLLVVGEGPAYQHLSRLALPNVRMLGFQDDQTVADLLSRARGYICASEEDFGIAMVEAQASGCPVIAYRKGGALEIITENQTGLFFNEQAPDSLVDAVCRFENQAQAYVSRTIQRNAAHFGRVRFQGEFGEFMQREMLAKMGVTHRLVQIPAISD